MKKLLYYTDVLPFLSKGEIAIDKLLRNFELLSSQSDKIRVVWHPYIKSEEYMKLNDFKYMDKYMQILQDYKKEGWGDFDECDDPKALADSCDAYYGDYSDAVYFMQESKKPVMIENFDV